MPLVIQIGNSDNKLTRQQWGLFIHSVNALLNGCNVHFRGGSSPEAFYENYCWVVDDNPHLPIRSLLAQLAKEYDQDSIAVIEGVVEFIR